MPRTNAQQCEVYVSQGKALKDVVNEDVGKEIALTLMFLCFFACKLIVAVLGHKPSWLVQMHCGFGSLHG